MRKIRTILIDDEFKASEILSDLLQSNFPEIDIIDTASSVKQSLDKLKDYGNNVDLVFLDIELGDGSGFDVLKELGKVSFKVIFTTAYNEFAVDAFKVNAIDYILKPIENKDLERSVKRVSEQIKKDEKVESSTHVSPIKEKKDLLFIHEHGHISFINLSDIVFFKAEGQYTTLTLIDGKKKTSSQNLGYYEKLIKDSFFYRIHRSYIVNLNFVSGINTSNQKVELKNGESIVYSAKEKESFMLRMNSF